MSGWILAPVPLMAPVQPGQPMCDSDNCCLCMSIWGLYFRTVRAACKPDFPPLPLGVLPPRPKSQQTSLEDTFCPFETCCFFHQNKGKGNVQVYNVRIPAQGQDLGLPPGPKFAPAPRKRKQGDVHRWAAGAKAGKVAVDLRGTGTDWHGRAAGGPVAEVVFGPALKHIFD